MLRNTVPELPEDFVITAANVSVGPDYDRWVDDVSLSIEPGEFVTLTGENGSGKSTFMNALAGIYDQEVSGQVSYGDTSIYDLRRPARTALRSAHFSMVGQRIDEELNLRETVQQNLTNSAFERGVKIDGDILDDVVSYYGLGTLMKRRAGDLSGGQKQLIPIARAEITRPRVLMMDEPMAALSDKRRDLVYERLIHLSANLGKTVVVVGHDPQREAPRKIEFELGRVKSDSKYPTTEAA